MAYSELIKNFERIRGYMKGFYIYGFKSRSEYDKKSGRSYDNERRRVESYLGDYMGFRQGENGKNVFISIDSRNVPRNPLYTALKAKSFTDGDITLHFILLDILYSPKVFLTLSEITEKIDSDYLSHFKNPLLFDESTVRKKLKEYIELGIIVTKKDGKKVLYSRAEDADISSLYNVLSFFSEEALCGALGSFLLDNVDFKKSVFSFKHHYITQALESEVLFSLLSAVSEKRTVTFKNTSRRAKEEKCETVVPVKILISVQGGRSYVAAYSLREKMFKTYRLDYLREVEQGEPCEDFDILRERFSNIQKNIWGVVCRGNGRLETVTLTVQINDNEEYIYRRLLRECRCGTVERLDKNTCRFFVSVYDSSELTPWLRTFIGRIISLEYSNKLYERRFREDLNAMYRLYGLNEDAKTEKNVIKTRKGGEGE